MKNLRVICLSLLLILVACGGEDETPSLGLEGVAENPLTTEDMLAPSEDEPVTENNSTLEASGYLAYLQNQSLYVYDFATKTATEISAEVGTPYLYTSPDQTKLYYLVVNFEERQAMPYEYHFADGSTTALTGLFPPTSGTAIWMLDNWSPDGEWAFMQSFQMGTQPFLINFTNPDAKIELPSSFNAQLWWTADNQLIYVALERRIPPIDIPEHEYFPTIESISLVNLANGELADLTSEFDVSTITTEEALLNTLTDEGYVISNYDAANPDSKIWFPAGRNHQEFSSQYCWEYAIGQGDLVLYMANDVYHLGNLVELATAELVFMQIEFPDCSFLNGPTGKLVKFNPMSGEALILTEQVTSIQDRNTTEPFFLQSRFTVAPTEDYVAVVETDANGTSSRLAIINLATSESLPLLIDGAPVENVTSVAWGQ